MRTNFEKWKENLKPEDLIITDFCTNEVRAVFDRHADGCEYCPSKDTCLARRDPYNFDCESGFLAWANAPAKENEE